MDNVLGMTNLTLWASRLFKRPPAPAVECPAVVVAEDAVRVLPQCQNLEALRSCGQRARLGSREMSSQRVVFSSDRELNLGEVLTVKLFTASGPVSLLATVLRIEKCRRIYRGELQLHPDNEQRRQLLEHLKACQATRLESAPQQPLTGAVLPLPRTISRSGLESRVRRVPSSTRSIRRPAS
ncbi:hypothetical protein DYH09_24220 [bacterium CPR1]|nr:hypothetical protein [bacterium CPR1]